MAADNTEGKEKQAAVDAECAVGAECDIHMHNEAPAEPAVRMDKEGVDKLNVAELVPQLEIDAPSSDVKPEVSPVEPSAADDEPSQQDSGIALPAESVARGTGIPLPSAVSVEQEVERSSDHKEQAAVPAKQVPEPKRTVVSRHADIEAVREIEEEYSEVRRDFGDEDDQYTQAGIDCSQAGVEHTQAGVDELPEMLSARQLGAAITSNSMFALEPLAALTEYRHLYTALLDVKGVWQSSVSMDELIVAAARGEQSDPRNEEVKNWYVMRVKKLVVNVCDFVWIAAAYDFSENGLLVVDNEELFSFLTGVSSRDFNELCSRGFINSENFAALVQQYRLWDAETMSPADYIIAHLRRERMVA